MSRYDWFVRNIGGISAVPEVLPSGDIFVGTDEGVIAVIIYYYYYYMCFSDLIRMCGRC